jgi:hypothetical protein
MALTTAEVTAVSRNSGTRRIREDTQGHDQGANQAQEETGGAAGIRKDTTLGRFGTVRPRVQIPGPRPISDLRLGVSIRSLVIIPLYYCSSSAAMFRAASNSANASVAVCKTAAKALGVRLPPGPLPKSDRD